MARRKKSETPGSAKPSNIVAVRKSSRQIARRQSFDGKKLNGEIIVVPEEVPVPEEQKIEEKPAEVVMVKRKRGRPPKNHAQQQIIVSKPNNVQQNGPQTPKDLQKLEIPPKPIKDEVVKTEISKIVTENASEANNSKEIPKKGLNSQEMLKKSPNLNESLKKVPTLNETSKKTLNLKENSKKSPNIHEESGKPLNLNDNAKKGPHFNESLNEAVSLKKISNETENETKNVGNLNEASREVEKVDNSGGNSSENLNEDVNSTWTDDVIEETIICEEMEVETEGYVHQEPDVVLEQVLVMDDQNYEGKDVVYVIQNEDGTESMVMPSAGDVEGSDYQIIEQGVECLSVSEMSKSTDKLTKAIPECLAASSSKECMKISEKSVKISEKSVKNCEKLTKNSGKSTSESLKSPCRDLAPEKSIKNSERPINQVLNSPCEGVQPRKPGRPPKNSDKLAKKNEKSVKNCEKSAKPSKSPKVPVISSKIPEISHKVSEKMNEISENSAENAETSVKMDVDEENTILLQVGNFSNINPTPSPPPNLPKKIERRGRPRTPKEKIKKSVINQLDDNISPSIGNQLSIEDSLEVREDSNCSIQDVTPETSAHRPVDPVKSPKVEEKSAQMNEKMDFSRDNSIFLSEEDLQTNNNRPSSPDELMGITIVEKSIEMSEESSRESDIMEKITQDLEKMQGDDMKTEDISERTDKFQEIAKNFEIIEKIHKIDSEDVKISSGSENSNDTASLSSIRTQESSDKSSTPWDTDKKDVFRSRSGSTDTTGSESGSNSSAIRRSSRIRSQGLAKQRSRGRGLVTKPVADVSRAFQQEKEKLNSNPLPSPRDTPDSQSETQSDKENSNKLISQDVNTPTMPMPPSPFDSEPNKPVKVKSRWRRSSELEMGNSNAGKIGFGILNPAERQSLPKISENFLGESQIEDKDSKAMSPEPEKPEIDAEVQERLSQFEILKENMYLTERYTNKETKRMTCDCFLTEEELERGELGCGEDCLNRLLMIECGPRCNINDRCTNKRFQNCEYAKCEVFRTEKKGLGLRAAQNIEAGEFIMEYVGEVLDTKDFRRRAKEYSKDKNKHYYFMALKSDQIIDATIKGNISRFINHSCDPNAETQKWTVNGELRIGFFNRRFIAAGDEITFDYHFQRYGKEAQKCFCEAATCRGWIGETPDEEKEKAEKKEKRERDVKKKREPKKTYMEDEDLEEEIDKLCSGGLKNRAHTLTLSRLMVRSREMDHRTRFLKVIQDGDQACRRLFLDYHGLRLIWSYMMDVADLQTEEAQIFRVELLETLKTLPIPNKTMLIDSKVLGVVEKWSKEASSSLKLEPQDVKMAIEELGDNCDSNDKMEVDQDSRSPTESKETSPRDKDASPKDIKDTPSPEENEEVDRAKAFHNLSMTLLANWSTLKEVFRIPKKERIEQMKEHEREADSGYREDSEREERRETYDRHRSYSRREDTRRRGRESPDPEAYVKNKDRLNVTGGPKLSKYERRQLFAMKVAKQEEERIRRQQQELFQVHESKCMALGLDPLATPLPDSQTGYPLFFHPNMGQWQPYPFQENEQIYPHTMAHPPDVSPGITGSVYQGYPPPGYPPSSQQFDGHLQVPNNLIHNGVPPPGSVPPPTAVPPPVYLAKPPELTATSMETVEEIAEPALSEVPPIDLPPGWKCAKDTRGRVYYYHVKERVSQWLPPPPTHIGVPPDSSSSSESSDETSSSSSEEEEEDEVEERKEESDPTEGEKTKIGVKVTARTPPTGLEAKKRRDGLVQERIISPRREEDRVDHKKYKDIKEKLRRQKEKIKLKEQVDKMRKLRRANKAKTQARHTAIKLQAIAQSNELTAERKIKDSFRVNMATVMVKFLNPFRQNDCKQGRITNTEDFKYLARKLTHFVMAKELKHCKSVDELQCNDNVKHKAKDFVRKYMNKFGPIYQRSSDDD